MASLGAAKTGKFQIGTQELRIGPLTMAGRLDRRYSVGLIDQATLTVDQTSVDLLGGFPQVIQDTQVVNQSAQITATLREFSRRNLAILLGQGLVYENSNDGMDDATAILSGNLAENTAAVGLTPVAGSFVAGDWITIFNANDASQCVITKFASGSTSTLDDNFLPSIPFLAGSKVTRLAPVAVGNVSSVNYFTVQLIGLDRQSGRPLLRNFWKAAIGSGMTLANNATDFASTDMTLKILQPSLNDYEQSGSDLYHLRDIIATFPMGLSGEVSDESTSSKSWSTTTTAAPGP